MNIQMITVTAMQTLCPDLAAGIDYQIDSAGNVTWPGTADPRAANLAAAVAGITSIYNANLPNTILKNLQSVVLSQSVPVRSALLPLSINVQGALQAGDVEAAQYYVQNAKNPTGSPLSDSDFSSLISGLLLIFPS